METKVCSQCQTEKPLSEFYKKKASKDGHRPECIECYLKHRNKEKARELYLNLTDEQKLRRLTYAKEQRLKLRLLKPPKPVKPPKPTKEEKRKQYSEAFLIKANQKHNGKYDYSLVNYQKRDVKIKIICPIHGVFEQRPGDHLRYGCGECGGTKQLTTENFIEKAKKIHGNKYDYSLVEYQKAKVKVKVICPIHGIFEIDPNNHLFKKGCRQCGLNTGVWSFSQWEEKGLKSTSFDSFKLYIIECWNDDERFYKIGKTFKTVNDRFKGNSFMPYNYKVLKVIEGDAKYISELEVELKNKNNKHPYQPKLKFNGWYECYVNVTY